MGQRLYLPDEVKASIAQHVVDAVERARDGYLSAAEDEDTLTGHLGALLRIGKQNVTVLQGEIRGTWSWSLDYRKFRGRGNLATESILGADGIFELKIDHGFKTDQKSLLFQAKKEWSNDAALFRQALKLSTWREAAFVLNFTPAAFEAYQLDDVVQAHGRRTPNLSRQLFSHLLGADFPECKIGDTELAYNAVAKRLFWRDHEGEVVAADFNVGHRIRIEVKRPRPSDHLKADKLVPLEEVHLHRMSATNEAQLSIPLGANSAEIKKAYRRVALAYHPDKMSTFERLYRDIATSRMQGFNQAKDELLKVRVNR